MNRANGDDIASTDTALRETELEIARSRERLAASIGALREEITTLTDWREWIRARPAPFIGGAFALGLLLGWRAARR
jgi:hypothetical protein